jgi:hypothetical protein
MEVCGPRQSYIQKARENGNPIYHQYMIIFGDLRDWYRIITECVNPYRMQ